MIHDSAVQTYKNPELAPWVLSSVYSAGIAQLQATKVGTATANLAGGYAALDINGLISGFVIPYGTTANTVCQGNDPRLSDARTPSGPATGDLSGTYPGPQVSGLQGNPLAITEADGFVKRNWNNSAWECKPYGERPNTVLQGSQADRLYSLEYLLRTLILELSEQHVPLSDTLTAQIELLEPLYAN